MALSPFWTFLIIAIVVLVFLFVGIFTVFSRLSPYKVTNEPLPALKPFPNPWVVTNKAGWPLDPLPVPQYCPTCQLYTFTGSNFQPVNPRIQALPNCLGVTCFAQECLPDTKLYPTCYWPDQLFAFDGSHKCGVAQGPTAGTGCVTQQGQTVPIDTVETYYSNCGSRAPPPCKVGTLDLVILNWTNTQVYPITPQNPNPFKEFYCMQYMPNAVFLDETVYTEPCDISVSEQLWVITRYSYNGIVLYQDDNGSLMSIYNRANSSFLIPEGYNPSNPNWHPPPGTQTIHLQFIKADIPTANVSTLIGGVWWMYYNLNLNFNVTIESQVVNQQASPQIVFIPDYTQVPSPIFPSSLIQYLEGSFSIIPEYQWQDYSQNFEEAATPGEYNYVLNTLGTPVSNTILQLRPFMSNRNLTTQSQGVWHTAPLQFTTKLLDYTDFSSTVSSIG